MALVKKYPARILAIINNIQGLYTLEIESLGKPFKFDPGQYLHLAIDVYDSTRQWPESRCFSMQSAPGNPVVRITYAVKGKFTSRMEKMLKPGSEITVKLPYGDLFSKPHNKGNTVFIAGGTGITPFISLFTYESFKVYINPNIYLGFRSKEYNIYAEELKNIQNSSATVNYFYQDIDGILDIKQIFMENGSEKDYFISGPPNMIKNCKSFLTECGINSQHILSDDWE